jgi:hypothetical protein
MSHAELVVVPTLYEAGSFPLNEAMNYGIPVICSNVTSLPDQIQDKRYIFDPNNIDEMADKMNMMLTDKMARQMNTDNSHKIIREQLWEKRINYFVETYDRAIIDFQVRMQCPDLKRITSGAEFWFENSMRSVTSSRFWTITLPLRKIAHILRPKFL